MTVVLRLTAEVRGSELHSDLTSNRTIPMSSSSLEVPVPTQRTRTGQKKMLFLLCRLRWFPAVFHGQDYVLVECESDDSPVERVAVDSWRRHHVIISTMCPGDMMVGLCKHMFFQHKVCNLVDGLLANGKYS